MIYVTGDTHIPIDISKLNAKRFTEQKNMTEKDFVVICGDFGGVWDNTNEERYWLKWFGNKSFTTLFVDGNHENHDALSNRFSTVKFHGGNVHQIGDKIFHLMRGQIYEIEDKRIFTMGGGSSHDKEYRKEGRNWWEEELPSKDEYDTATRNLQKVNWKVDYIITHCAPDSIQKQISSRYDENELTHFLEMIKQSTTFDKWFFGHYHIDEFITSKCRCIFNDVIRIN